MCIETTGRWVYPSWRVEQWSQHTLCANFRHGRGCAEKIRIDHPTQYVPAPYDGSSSYPYATQQRNPTPQCIPAPPSIPSVSYRSGDKSDRGYTNNSSVSDQTVLDDKRRGHSPGSRRQEPIAHPIRSRYAVPKTAPFVINDERTRPPEQRHVQFKEVNNHRHLTNHSRNLNSASDSRHLDNRERRARRPVEMRQQEADRRLRTHIAESNARTASRPVVQHRGVESMNPRSRKYHTGESHDTISVQEAQKERLRERFHRNPDLTASDSRWRPDEKGGYRYD